MKNLFKKSAKKSIKAEVQTLDKKQLKTVTGGETTKPTVSIQDESKGFSSLIR